MTVYCPFWNSSKHIIFSFRNLGDLTFAVFRFDFCGLNFYLNISIFRFFWIMISNKDNNSLFFLRSFNAKLLKNQKRKQSNQSKSKWCHRKHSSCLLLWLPLWSMTSHRNHPTISAVRQCLPRRSATRSIESARRGHFLFSCMRFVFITGRVLLSNASSLDLKVSLFNIFF